MPSEHVVCLSLAVTPTSDSPSRREATELVVECCDRTAELLRARMEREDWEGAEALLLAAIDAASDVMARALARYREPESAP
jgi:hypothetical protein